MENMIELDAPCKINIHLRVLDKREDGFHGIESIFQAVSFCDRLVLSRSPIRSECRIECPRFDLPPVNTVSRAVGLFRDKTGIHDGIRVYLDKQIPAGAGLGGGSSDAAATLEGLNRLFDAGLSAPEMHDLACQTGSDVPFFLGSTAAIVTGRGDELLPLVPRTDVYGLLLWPGVHCGTAEAYQLVDSWKRNCTGYDEHLPAVGELAALYSGLLEDWSRMGNSFSVPVQDHYPVIRDACADLHRAGSFYAEMSGSGSSVFGLFREKKEAEQAFSLLSTRWQLCRKFLLLAHSPMR